MSHLPLAPFAVLALAVANPAAAADPPVGATQTLPVVTLAVAADGTARDARRAVYAPPPGWYVRSHRVVVTHKSGVVSYAVNTVPAGLAWRAEEQATADARQAGAATVTAYHLAAGGQAAATRSAAAAEVQGARWSHHLLVVEAVARGPGLWGGGSGLELTVEADLVYLGR